MIETPHRLTLSDASRLVLDMHLVTSLLKVVLFASVCVARWLISKLPLMDPGTSLSRERSYRMDDRRSDRQDGPTVPTRASEVRACITAWAAN